MAIKLITAVALAASMLALPQPAEAGGKRHGFTKDHGFHSVHHRRHRHGRFHRHFRFDDFYQRHRTYRSCRYLKRKAYRTGSRYWWNQYRLCANRYY